MKGMKEVATYLNVAELGEKRPLTENLGIRAFVVRRVSGELSVVAGKWEPGFRRYNVVYDPYVGLGMIREYLSEFSREEEAIIDESDKKVDVEIEKETDYDSLPEEVKAIMPKPEKAATSKKGVVNGRKGKRKRD